MKSQHIRLHFPLLSLHLPLPLYHLLHQSTFEKDQPCTGRPSSKWLSSQSMIAMKKSEIRGNPWALDSSESEAKTVNKIIHQSHTGSWIDGGKGCNQCGQISQGTEGQKKQKVKSTEILMKKKGKETEDFYRCKSKCMCKEDRCLATGLKECPSCHSILRSMCSKARCKVDCQKPKMLLAIAATKKRTSRKLFESNDESGSETDVSDESDSEVDEDKSGVSGQNPPGQNPPGQNPPDKIPLDKIPPRTKSPQDKIPLDKIPPVYFIFY